MAKPFQRAAPIAFTEKRVGNLPTPAKGDRELYVDTEPTGLRLRVTPSKRTWYTQYHPAVSSGTIKYTLGVWPAMSVSQARDEARKVLGKVASAESPAEARRSLRSELTFGELAELYFDDRERAGKRTVEDTRAQYQRWVGTLPDVPPKKHGRKRVKPTQAVNWTSKRVSEITRENCAALHRGITDASIEKPGAKRSAGQAVGGKFVANRVIDLLHAIFEFGIDGELITANPARHVTLNPEPSRWRFLMSTEVTKFLAEVESETQPWRDYFATLLYVGYRRSAIASMAWDNINLDDGRWRVPNEKAKNGLPIVLALTGPALEILRARYAQRESKVWVFPGGGRDGHITEPKEAWKRICNRAGLTETHIHDLRRTLGSWMAMAGESLPAIGRALGHKDPRSTEVYAYLQADAVAASVDRGHEKMADSAKKADAAKKAEEEALAQAAITQAAKVTNIIPISRRAAR